LVAVDLAFSETGSGDPLVILHGLFGSKKNWASVARILGDRHRVLTVDLRNHGESPWDPLHDYPSMADDVAEFIRGRVGGPAAVLGHSMGGKVAMALALTRPELVDRLVVVDIAPARSAISPLAPMRAMRAVPLETLSKRAEVENALARLILNPAVRGFLVQNVKSGLDGLAWTLNLDALESNVETIRGFPEIPRDLQAGRPFAGPTLFLFGSRSEYLRPDDRPEIERLFPAAAIEVIDGAGHWVHADAPAPFIEAVNRFLPGRSAMPDPASS